MMVADVMTPLIVSVNADASVVAAARLMQTNNVGFLPVRERGRLVGTLTDRDITVRAVAQGNDLQQVPVEAVMTSDVVTVAATMDLAQAAETMEHAEVSRLMVVDEDGQLVGVLSIRDIPQAPLS